MTRRRWIADEVSPQDGLAWLTGQNAAHLARVLRARVGQEFELALPELNRVHLARVISINEERVEFQLGEQLPAPGLPEITLLLSVFKFDRFEWAVEKATELGVFRIVPVVASRTDSHLASAAPKRAARWRRIAHEAAQQSRRVTPPEIVEPLRLKDALTQLGVRIVLAESERTQTMARMLCDFSSSELALAIGPEGGWTQGELRAFIDAGWTPASLGGTILRAETAAIAAVALAASHFDNR